MKAQFLLLVMILSMPLVISQSDESIENLGFKVNSQYHELAPVISSDGKLLYFVRMGHPQNTMYKKGKNAVLLITRAG